MTDAPPPMPPAIAEVLHTLAADDAVSESQIEAAIGAVLEDAATEVDIAALLTAQALRGETAALLAGAARALRARATRITPHATPLLDTCGTGGTGVSTFNISTATALVTAACGVPVAKHGNRAATSRSGSADVLEALGVRLDIPPEAVAACIDAVGIGFLYARSLHPAMARVAPVRKRLPFRTLFNLIGPLSNPAGASRQLLGTGRHEAAVRLAHAAHSLGTERTVVVCGDGVLDEVTLAGPTTWHLVEGSSDAANEATDDGTLPSPVTTGTWLPQDFGVDAVPVEALGVDSPEQSATTLRKVFAGENGPARAIVQANTAAALWTAGVVDSVAEGSHRAAAAIDDGSVAATIEALVRFTTDAANS